MPDLDELLGTLAAEVKAATRAPGASTAIKRARQRRRKVAVTAVAAVAVVVLGGGVAGTLPGDDEAPSAVDVTTGPISSEVFEARVREALADVRDWDVVDRDPTFLLPCAGDWAPSAGWSGGDFGLGPPDESTAASAFSSQVFFPSSAEASNAVAGLVEALESCSAVEWRTQPIPQTDAVLASSADGVVWIQRKGATVATLEVPTDDGPPPASVQIEVADLLWASIR